MKRIYVPKQGDVISIDFNPQAGHEQKGRRPALVLSKTLFNQKTHLAMACPITHTHRGFTLHISLPAHLKTKGFIMAEQIKSIDYKARHARFIERAPEEILQEALSILDACLYDE